MELSPEVNILDKRAWPGVVTGYFQVISHVLLAAAGTLRGVQEEAADIGPNLP